MPLNVREVVGAKPPPVRPRPEKAIQSTRASVRRTLLKAVQTRSDWRALFSVTPRHE